MQLKFQNTNRFRLFFLLTLIACTSGFAQKAKEVTITGIYNQQPLAGFLNSLQNKYNLKVFYKPGWIEKYKITARFENTPLTEALNTIFEDHELTWQFFQNDAIVIYRRISETRKVSDNNTGIIVIGDLMNVGKFKTAWLKGTVVDGKNGEPITGAIVYEPATKKGASTNANGEFELELSSGEHELQFNFMGFQNTILR